MKYPILDRAADLSLPKSLLPTPSEVVDTLLTAEKIARKEKTSYSLEDLIGTWKLRFITGTKKTRQKAGIVLGAGRYIPQFIKIEIQYDRAYSKSEDAMWSASDHISGGAVLRGNLEGLYAPSVRAVSSGFPKSLYAPSVRIEEVRVKNCVKLGFLTLSLTGPVKFLASKNILVFDFTTITVLVLGIKLYDGYIRGGKVKEAEFEEEKIANQAFFVYFLIQKNLIAARGKGGGLALWSKVNQ